jgi:hypothetical protein
MIRQFEREDIPTVVDFHRRIFGLPPGPPPPSDLFYTTIFFDHPWYDPEISSLMYESDGQLVGFMGIVARPMRFKGEQIRVAVPTRFMVDAERGGALIAVQLLRALAAGPQVAAINDSSNEVMRQVWLRAGADLLYASSMHWVRPFLPAERWRRRIRERGGIADIGGRFAWPLSRAADLLADRAGWNDFSVPPGAHVDPDPDAAALLPLIESESARYLLSPVYEEATLAWQLGELERMGRHRRFCSAVVRSKKGRELGWYMYYHETGGVSEVLQLVAAPGQEETVVAALLTEARERGAIAIRGRTDVRLLAALTNQRCAFMAGDPWSLVMTRDDEFRWALQGKDALFSRLEGEWW